MTVPFPVLRTLCRLRVESSRYLGEVLNIAAIFFRGEHVQ